MFDGVITVFNYDKETEKYYPAVLENVEIQCTSAVILLKTGPSAADTASVHISYSENYRKPLKWQKSEDKSNIFTFNTKNGMDFIYCGRWTNTEPVSDDDYSSGFYQYMSSNYDDVYMISTVAEYAAIPHWELGVR